VSGCVALESSQRLNDELNNFFRQELILSAFILGLGFILIGFFFFKEEVVQKIKEEEILFAKEEQFKKEILIYISNGLVSDAEFLNFKNTYQEFRKTINQKERQRRSFLKDLTDEDLIFIEKLQKIVSAQKEMREGRLKVLKNILIYFNSIESDFISVERGNILKEKLNNLWNNESELNDESFELKEKVKNSYDKFLNKNKLFIGK
jgi:hypothetical protein